MGLAIGHSVGMLVIRQPVGLATIMSLVVFVRKIVARIAGLISDGRSTRIRPEKTPRQSKSTLKNSDPQGGLGFTRAFADLGLNVKALCRRHTLIFEPCAGVGDDNYEDFTLNAG